MLECSLNDIGQNLHIAMPVLSKSLCRRDNIVVDHP